MNCLCINKIFHILMITIEFIIQMHRLSTELITTSNKITGLEKIIEKVIIASLNVDSTVHLLSVSVIVIKS